MFRIKPLIIVTVCVVFAATSNAIANPESSQVSSAIELNSDAQLTQWLGSQQYIERIQKIVEAARERTPQRIGISFVDLKTNQVMVEYASNDLFHPASNIKLLTSAAALHVLGARHRWLTLVGTDRVKNQSIGNLIVRGGGDPSLSVGDIAEWALKLKSQGILSIEGDIIIDASLFKSFGLPPGFEEKNQDGAYRPSISSINLNWNHILIKVTDRGKAAGHVAVFPPNDYVKIINQTRVTKKVKRPILVKQKVSKTNQQVVVKGELKRKIQIISAENW